MRALAAAVAALAAAGLAAVLALAFRPDAEGLRARAGRLADARIVGRSVLGASTVEDVRLRGTTGLTARCSVRSPHVGGREPRAARAPRLAPERRPAFLLAAGYETGRRAVEFPEVGGVVLLACDYPFEVPDATEPLDLPALLADMRRALLDSPAVLLIALDYLATRPDVDAGRMAVVGASVGVPPAIVAAALDSRVRAAALLYGGADLPLLFAHNVDLGSGPTNRLARVMVRLLSRPVEPARWAGRISPRPTLAINAPDDRFIPRRSALALHRALRDPREVRWLSLDHVAAFHERDLLAALTELTAVWFRRHGVG